MFMHAVISPPVWLGGSSLCLSLEMSFLQYIIGWSMLGPMHISLLLDFKLDIQACTISCKKAV